MKDKENSREIQFKEELVRKAKNGDTKAFSLLSVSYTHLTLPTNSLV